MRHYRCHIGHSYTDADLILKQAESIEQTIWVAVRMMEERKILMKKLAKESNEKGLEHEKEGSQMNLKEFDKKEIDPNEIDSIYDYDKGAWVKG